MLADVLSALQDVALIEALRRTRWVYPFVNAGHIVGLALLFGAIVPLDLRTGKSWCDPKRTGSRATPRARCRAAGWPKGPTSPRPSRSASRTTT